MIESRDCEYYCYFDSVVFSDGIAGSAAIYRSTALLAITSQFFESTSEVNTGLKASSVPACIVDIQLYTSHFASPACFRSAILSFQFTSKVGAWKRS